MIAIISDVHGNYPALKAVLAEIDKLNCTKIISLGDVSGYYCMVNECIDEFRKRSIVNLMGNHDYYILGRDNCPRSYTVNRIVEYQRRIITPENMEYLEKSVPGMDDGFISARHGGWKDPIDEYIEEYHLDALTLRCWNEMETYLRVCPCVLLSELNDRGIVASCEIDMCSALTMRAMNLASEEPTAVLDWNNNYGDDENKVILFHCGPVAQGLMTAKGTVTEHKMFAKNDPGSGWGCNEGRIKAFPTTISNCQTKDGKIIVYASEAEFTNDPIEDAFFGCGGVCEIPDLQNKLIKLARGGFKHHTSVGVGHMKEILKEAFTTYLGYEWVEID